MYTNFTKGQAFPLAIRVCSKPLCSKPFHTLKLQSLQIGSHLKPSLNLSWVKLTKPACGMSNLVHFSTDSCCKILENGVVAKPRSFLSGFRVRCAIQNWALVRGRGFSSWSTVRVNSVGRSGKRLPWLPAAKAKGAKGLEKATPVSSWEESAKRLDIVSDNVSWGESAERLEGDGKSSWDKSAKRVDKETKSKAGRSFREVSAKTYVRRSGPSEERSSRTGRVSIVKDRQSDYRGRDKRLEEANTEGVEDKEEEEEEEMEPVDDPRWDNIKSKFRGMEDVRSGAQRPQRPEFRRWNRQEDWGKKTWNEATESSVPRMVGQGVYGVGPVLAALSAGRREFYALYIQEGLDLSKNNRKKKDKKGFERILRMADKIGLTIKDVSKHDLNMVSDNRPHQGLLLDASPLEMVKITELDPVSLEEDKGSLWVALDEVTDPQNVGAIIRSAYFFGASGVVLCAKNSAPLSGVVSKASAGSLELMELRYCKNMMQFLTSSAENGWRVLGGSVSSKAIPLNEVEPSVPTILVLGSEGTGLRPLVEKSCTDLIRIPGNIPVDATAGGGDDIETAEVNHGCSAEEFRSFLAVESLNVSVAAGVLLHHLTGNNTENDVHVVYQHTGGLD